MGVSVAALLVVLILGWREKVININMLVRVLMTIPLLAASAAADALTFEEALNLAWRNDPTFLTAQANLHVSHERARQAVAALLPQLTANASAMTNRRDYTPRNQGSWMNSAASPSYTLNEAYNSASATLRLTQPLWHHGSLIAKDQAELTVSQADSQLLVAAQELLVRLTQRWFAIMESRDAVMTAETQIEVMQQQLDLSKDGYGKGVLAYTELEDAAARYQKAKAEYAVAQGEFEKSLAALEQIIGQISFAPPFLSEQHPLPVFMDDSLEPLLSMADKANPSLRAAQYALEAASQEVRKQNAGHEPTLDLVASYGMTTQEAGVTGGQPGFDSRDASIGLQLSMPLYAGGGQVAKVREAMALRARAAQELEAARRNARLAVKEAWFSWNASRVREESARQSVESTSLALDGAESARQHGVKADIDVLQAQQQQAVAKREWRKARYDNIVSQIKLMAACGQLTQDDLRKMDSLFSSDAH